MTAAEIAVGYPVTIGYVARMLEVFTEKQTIALLDYYSSVGHFPPIEEVLKWKERGLGRHGS